MNKQLQSGQHPDADQISAFVDHALPAHEREDMLAHLAGCADCRETVALSLPATENEPATTAAVKKPRSWTWGMRLLWPATAAALTVVLLVFHYAANSHKGSGGPGPGVALERPVAPTKTENAPLSTSGGSAGSSSFSGRKDEASGKAPRAYAAAASAKEKSVTGTNRLAADTTRSATEMHLPGDAMAVSTVARGRQVLAIDDRNNVFLSNDGGVSWLAVQAPWKGRAVKAELVSYPVLAKAREKAIIGEVPYPGANSAADDKAVNSPDADRFRAQKSLRQELKGGYQGPMSGGAAPTAPPAPVLTAPVPNVPPGSQTTLTGIIADRSGAAIPGASVALTNPANHASWTAVTGGDGHYRIDGLGVGTYQLEAQARGFNITRIAAVQIAASSPNTTNVTLDVGGAGETVMVQSAAPQIETTSPVLGSNVISLKRKSASPAALVQPTPVFEITTDTGDHWISTDGLRWRRQ
jgi:hypothetical protein